MVRCWLGAGEGVVVVVAEGEGEGIRAVVKSDIKRCRTRNSGYEHQTVVLSGRSEGAIMRRRRDGG